jgi:hypothetical protein
MRGRLRLLAILSLLCGLAAGGIGAWMYTRARAQAAEGLRLQQRALELYDQSDTVKETPAENRLIEEGQRYEREGDETLRSAHSSRLWALISGVCSIVFMLVSIAAMMAHLKRKEAGQPS